MPNSDAAKNPKETLVDLSKWLATLAVSVIAWIVINARPTRLICSEILNAKLADKKLMEECLRRFPLNVLDFNLSDVRGFWLLVLALAFVGLSIIFSFLFRASIARRDEDPLDWCDRQKIYWQMFLLVLGSVCVVALPLSAEKGAEQLSLKVDGLIKVKVPANISLNATGFPENINVKGTVNLGDVKVKDIAGNVSLDVELPKGGAIKVVVPPLTFKEEQKIGIDPKYNKIGVSGSVTLSPSETDTLKKIEGHLGKIKESAAGVEKATKDLKKPIEDLRSPARGQKVAP